MTQRADKRAERLGTTGQRSNLRSTLVQAPTRAITFDSTRRHDFRLLLVAVGVSAVGSRVTRTALPMAAILLLGATPLQLGWLSVLGVLPGALVAWWAGASVCMPLGT